MLQAEKGVHSIMDRARQNSHTVEDFKEKGCAIHKEPEDEEYLCWLTAEEKECLQFLLETINSLDADEQTREDEAESSTHFSEKEQNVQGGTETCEGFVNFKRKPRLEISQRALSETVKATDKTEHQSAAFKVKMTKSFSEESPGVSVSRDPKSFRKVAGTHPGHLKKFDTIMRSGVNVQELRARFVAQRAASDLGALPKSTEVSGANKQSVQLSGVVKSPREEALHKLGLLERNQSLPSLICPPETFLACTQVADSAVQHYETTQGVSRLSGGSSSMINSSGTSQSSGGNDHEQALRKLGLLKF
ncbi:uncharacterized protein LOC115472778 [Microcaecilia unicolor]|uniref:Uncharacterized protein LOC115472778 n=1 Tax=Microcaecilia unicolor TaxID=1415580 RepID=A0A6P7YJ22_9AMPH|nr:uncharacterized protein LOC115472778 [Microcaecilia unicolor]